MTSEVPWFRHWRWPDHRAALLGAAVATALIGLAAAQPIATPAQKRACTPDVYRLCASEIPNRAAITACLRRKRGRLSEACRAVFEQ
ncbi:MULTISPECIES: hypothetical protein [Rhodopseudomonas]|uniref:hypothetical protein n=1 Tax=Rhodopseudomonas TaxID=1073 RepID=UPI0005C8F6E4|nr:MULTISPECIES: hypothetical protein [Rhodopseudomonas]MDF3813688.1 hypothetical protein [Rhodopseudomonas sp. BAL398]WOK18818.1 hypothetical protein RBJ75_04635 [Rhodopseudomonas sp. BAL398]